MGEWTPELLGSRLIEAFRGMPGTAIFSPRVNDLRPCRPSQQGSDRASQLALIGLTARYVPRESRERLAILTWARARAGHGTSVSEFCREMGWDRGAFELMRNRAARAIADGLNQDARGPSGTKTDTLLPPGA